MKTTKICAAGAIAMVLFAADEQVNAQERDPGNVLLQLTTCEGHPVTIAGTPGDDDIVGTQGADVIHGLAGNDNIIALGGDDVVCGGDGEDIIDLGSGNDRAFGGRHADTINGNDDDDVIQGNAGRDTIRCHDGNDWADGGIGIDSFLNDDNDCETVVSIGYSVHDAPLNSDAQYARVFDDNDELARSFVVAGCVPQDHSVQLGVTGSDWVACNDTSIVKDKVVESPFVACSQFVPNGVVRSMSVTEFRNRKWTNFSFTCSALNAATGRLEPEEFGSGSLFTFTNSGTTFVSSTDGVFLPTAIKEKYNQLELTSNRLLSVRFITNRVNAEEDGLDYSFNNITPEIPDSSPALIGLSNWTCPEDTALTGMAIGHIPKKNNKYTRPVYILGECRRILRD